jgi:hypothetical protein
MFELLVHPRLPPLVRSMPAMEVLVLNRQEESQEEAETRKSFGLVLYDDPMPSAVGLVQSQVRDEPTKITSTALGHLSTKDVSHMFVEKSATIPVKHVLASTSQTQVEVVSSIRRSVPAPVPVVVPETQMATEAEGLEMEVDGDEMPSIDLDSDSDG